MKKLFFTLFFILNLIFTPIIPFLLISSMFVWISISETYDNVSTNENIPLILITLAILFLFYIAKFISFPIIYKYGKNLLIYKFFTKIKKNIKFRFKVLSYAFLIDFLSISLLLNETLQFNIKDFPMGFLFCYISGAGGLLFCYLSLIIFFKVNQIKSKLI